MEVNPELIAAICDEFWIDVLDVLVCVGERR
jgi:hypothetical protein